VLRTLARFDPAVALTLAMHTHLVALQVWRHHQGMDAAPVFAKVVDGAVLVSTGASDWLPSNGSATAVDGGYVVSGRKAPASGAEHGAVFVTSIRWESPEGPKVLHCSIPAAADGVRIERTWDTLGLRATGSHTVVFEDVFVPEAAVSLVRPADEWHPIWSAVLGAAMPLIMAAYVGIADAAVEVAAGVRRGDEDPTTAQLLGEAMNAHTTAVDVLDAMFAATEDLRFANTEAFAARVLSRKTVVAEAAMATVRLAVEAVGGAAFSRGHVLERLSRDVQGAPFHPLPRARQTQLTGRVALGLSPA
jgi:acyl-CoA dehydrogenase